MQIHQCCIQTTLWVPKYISLKHFKTLIKAYSTKYCSEALALGTGINQIMVRTVTGLWFECNSNSHLISFKLSDQNLQNLPWNGWKPVGANKSLFFNLSALALDKKIVVIYVFFIYSQYAAHNRSVVLHSPEKANHNNNNIENNISC